MAVRVVSFEIKRIRGENGPERFDAWFKLAEACQAAANEFYKRWELWHFANDSATKIAQWQDQLRAHRKGCGPNPGKCPVECFEGFEASCEPSLYKQLAAKFPSLGTNTVTQLMNKLRTTLISKPAAQGSFPYWQAVILDQERRPCHTGPVPIPFPPTKCQLPETLDDGKCVLSLYVERQNVVDGRGEAIWDDIELVTKGRGIGSQLAVLRRMIEPGEGRWAFKGSSLFFHQRKNKWFAKLCYDRPKVAANIDPSKVAVLCAEEDRPWTLEIGDRRIWIGDDIAQRRRKFLRQGLGRKNNYRYAGSANKGHGRERAMAPQNILSRGWKDYVKSHNHATTKQVVTLCLQDNIGKIVYKQPTDAERDNLFLTRAGKIPGHNDSTGWDWYQVQAQLNYKAAEFGIEVSNERSGKPLKAKKQRKKKEAVASA